MTKEDFIAVAMEEGATRQQAEGIWDTAPEHGRDPTTFKSNLVREATRVWLFVERELERKELPRTPDTMMREFVNYFKEKGRL